MKQKEIFLQSEGDAWFIRNQQGVATRKLPDDDLILREILDIHGQSGGGGRLKGLEIGCGDGTRLAWLKNNLNADCYGIEPSIKSVAAACAKGINVTQGTADILPFADQSFDIVIFGFCLYLCDREDLFSNCQFGKPSVACARMAYNSGFFQSSAVCKSLSPPSRSAKLQNGLPYFV